MAVLLGLTVALTYGAADFLGGFASRRSSAVTVVLMTQFVGLLVAMACVFAFGWDDLGRHDVLLGAGAGLAQFTGVVALYRGLSTGHMGVVAPVSAVASAVLPIGYGLGNGEQPSGIALIGVAVAIVAVAIVAGSPGEPGTTRVHGRALLLALAAGVGFGFSFICFGETTKASGFWPVAIARVVASSVALIAVIATRRPKLPDPSDRRAAAATGVLDMTANGLLLLAVRGRLLSLVAPVASLYPVSTVVLARVVLQEPIGRRRLGGLALAGVALILIAR